MKILYANNDMEYLSISPVLPITALQGNDGVPEVISSMVTYDLMKDDWDALQELAHFSGRPDRVTQIPSKVRS